MDARALQPFHLLEHRSPMTLGLSLPFSSWPQAPLLKQVPTGNKHLERPCEPYISECMQSICPSRRQREVLRKSQLSPLWTCSSSPALRCAVRGVWCQVLIGCVWHPLSKTSGATDCPYYYCCCCCCGSGLCARAPHGKKESPSAPPSTGPAALGSL